MADVNNVLVFAISQAYEFLFADDDEEDDECTDVRRRKLQRVDGFAEILVNAQDDVEFKSHFR